MDVKAIEHIPCPLCKAMIRSRQSFVKQYMELCEHCKTKFALKFCVCKRTEPVAGIRQKYVTSDERYASRDRRGIDKDWVKLSPEKKLLEKDEVFYKNMYDFFRQFPPCSRTEPKYKIRPLIDDRLYGNVDDFFRNIGHSLSYDSVHPARYDDRPPILDEQPHMSEKYNYQHTERGMDDQQSISDKYSFRGAGPMMGDQHSMSEKSRGYYAATAGPVIDDGTRVLETHERHHKHYTGPEIDDHHRVVETRQRYGEQSDGHHRVVETIERHHEHFKGETNTDYLQRGPVIGDDNKVSETHERHHKYYSGPVMDDRHPVSEKSRGYYAAAAGPVIDDNNRVSQAHERHYKHYTGPEKDDHHRVVETRQRYHKQFHDGQTDGHHRVVETIERRHEHFKGEPDTDDHQRVSKTHEKRHKYYSGPLPMDDLRSISERPSEYSGPVMNHPHRVIETHERYHKQYRGGPVMDGQRPASIRHERQERYHKHYSGHEMDDHRPIAAKGYARRYQLHSGPVMDDEQRTSEKHKHFSGDRPVDDRHPTADRRQHKYSGGRGMDDRPQTSGRHHRYGGSSMDDHRYGGSSMDDHRPIGSKGYAKQYKLYDAGPLGAHTTPDVNEDRRSRRGDRTQKGYMSDYDTTPSSTKASEKGEKKSQGRKGHDDLLMIHERGSVKYVEKSPEVEKFKEYMEQVREQQKLEIEQKDRLWDVKSAEKTGKAAYKTAIRSKIESDRESQKRESQRRESQKRESQKRESPREDKKQVVIKKDTGKDGEGEGDKKKDKKSKKDTSSDVLKALESNEGIVPIKEAALHIDEMDARTSEKQMRKIAERLEQVAQKRRKPIIVEFIKRRKKSPRVRGGGRYRSSRLDSNRSMLERRRTKENIEPEKLSEIDAFNVSSSLGLDSIIIGPKIYHYKAPLKDSKKPNLHEPLVYKAMPVVKSKMQFIPVPEPKSRKGNKGKTAEEPAVITPLPAPTEWDEIPNTVEDMQTDGIISYALSDRKFIDKGWSKLPSENIVRRMNLYRMRPTHPDFDWFERNKSNEIMKFESGEHFAKFDNKEGRCQIYYKNGKIALEHYQCEEPLAQKRIVIYSKDDLCSVKKPQSILAIFDYLGNGVVFDHKGKIRLKFNQTEGIVFDKSLGPNCHWEWHSLNDPPQLKTIMVDTNLIYKDQDLFKIDDHHNVPKRNVDEAVHAIEMDNIVKEKAKKMTLPYKRFPIKIKSVKINDQFTLLIIDQATIYIKFKEGSTFFKTNIGLILDQNEIVETITEKMGAVMNSVERRPAPTESLAALQRTVLQAQRDDKRDKSRHRRVNRPADHCDSVDRMLTLLSKPLRVEASPLKPFICDCSLACTCPKD